MNWGRRAIIGLILPLLLVSDRLYSPELLVCLCPEDDKRGHLMNSPGNVCYHDIILHFSWCFESVSNDGGLFAWESWFELFMRLSYDKEATLFRCDWRTSLLILWLKCHMTVFTVDLLMLGTYRGSIWSGRSWVSLQKQQNNNSKSQLSAEKQTTETVSQWRNHSNSQRQNWLSRSCTQSLCCEWHATRSPTVSCEHYSSRQWRNRRACWVKPARRVNR